MAETSSTPSEVTESKDREQSRLGGLGGATRTGSGMALVGVIWACGRRLVAAFDEDHFLVVVDLPQLDLNDLAGGSLHMPAHETGLNRQLTMTAVDQHQQLYAPRTAVVKERIQRSAYRPASVENIIDQNDVASGNVKANSAWNDDRSDIAS